MSVGVISIQIRSELTFGPDRQDASLRTIAEEFSRKLDAVIAERVGGVARSYVADVQSESVVVHNSLLSFDITEQLESAKKLLSEQRRDIEEAVELAWKRHRRAIKGAKVSVAPSATSSPQPVVASDGSFEDFKREQAANERARWRAYAIGFLIGSVVGALIATTYWNVIFLRDEVEFLREEAREARQRPEAHNPVVIVYPPEPRGQHQRTPPPAEERRSRIHRTYR